MTDNNPEHLPHEFPLPDCQIGDRIKIFYGPGHSANLTLDVRGFVDDQIVVRWWRKHKNRWEYECKDGVWWHVFKKICTIVHTRQTGEIPQ